MQKYRIIDESLRKRIGDTHHFDNESAKSFIKQGKIELMPEIINNKESIRSKICGFNGDIPCFIPWNSNKDIGKSYNTLMSCIEDWVIFIDHDVLLVNPFWHSICISAIKKVGNDAGWITCYTNRIGCIQQRISGVNEKSDDIKYHRNFAKQVYEKNKGKIVDITDSKYVLSGFFILTNKKVWEKSGKFKEEGFFTVDNAYHRSVVSAGFRLYLMTDLYVYHSYFRDSIEQKF